MDPRTERAILQITIRFREPLTLPELARGIGLSPFYLHRLFKADTGETPAAYLNRIRLEHAAHLMVVLPDAPLLQIAIESGFASAATFARAFRNHFRMTASEYRRLKQLEVNADASLSTLALQTLPPRKLRVERCALDEDALNAGYARLGQRRPDRQCTALGIFVDAPFHIDRNICRHYLALEDDACHSDAFLLPGGLYARFRVTGDLDALSRAILQYKSTHIDPSPYAIGSTLAFERIVLPESARAFDYRRCERDVFIKIRRKHQPVI